MDDEAKQLLREIRDLQREQLEITRASAKEASEINRLALENHQKWNHQAKQSGKWVIFIFIGVLILMTVIELMKRSR